MEEGTGKKLVGKEGKTDRDLGVVLIPFTGLLLCMGAGLLLAAKFTGMQKHDLECLHAAWLVNSTVVEALLVAILVYELAAKAHGKLKAAKERVRG